MKKIILVLLLFGIIISNELFDQLLNETVSEEYCNDVISNLTALLEDGYVFLDFLKAPTRPEGKEDYIIKIDLISELNNISRKDRSFYDFYADIQNVLNTARDGHLSVKVSNTPNNNFPLEKYIFCLPFYYKIEEELDENKNVVNKYLSIQSNYGLFCECSPDIMMQTVFLTGLKILTINDLDPYKYFEEMSKKGYITHSKQGQYIDMLDSLAFLKPHFYPLKKEDLQVSIKFEGGQELVVEYNFEKSFLYNQEFKGYFLAEKENYFTNNIPLPTFKRMESDIIKKRINNMRKLQEEYEEEDEDEAEEEEEDFWQLKDDDNKIKCWVDEVNKFNVLYQKSFSPNDFYNYEDIMYKCFSLFYSNKYKLIIIEDRNEGGKTELCYPCSQYVRPKVSKPTITTLKSTQLLYETFFLTDEMLNPETCLPYTEKDNILEGGEEIYSDGIETVTHKKTKDIDSFNIYEKKIMEKKRLEFLKTGNTKKPTEILIFTDGAAFSCGSDFIRGLQIYGYGILVGFNSRPDLNKSDFEASESNSGVEEFKHSKYAQNLEKLGFSPYITYTEKFDPNDKTSPKVPMEFKIYPVDEIADIYIQYEDSEYNRFIKEAKRIFEKYNNLENGECNPDNKFLFYETDDCDSKLNIDKAHGGYLCGSNGKWDTNKCIAAYCDQGYILNDDRTECIRDPCQDIILKEIKINETKDIKINIEPNNAYIFTIEKENYSYYFYSEYEKFFYVFNERHVLKAVTNGTKFMLKDKIYVNYFVNITKNSTIKIKAVNLNPIPDNKGSGKDKGIPAVVIALIIIGSIIVLFAIIFVIIHFKRKKLLSRKEIDDKTKQLDSILE